MEWDPEEMSTDPLAIDPLVISMFVAFIINLGMLALVMEYGYRCSESSDIAYMQVDYKPVDDTKK